MRKFLQTESCLALSSQKIFYSFCLFPISHFLEKQLKAFLKPLKISFVYSGGLVLTRSLVFLNCEERNIENQIYLCENEENKNFGRIRPDGVVIRSQWDVRVSYTFVEFEENAEKENQNLKMLKKLPKIKVLSWG
ncbi:hypothetical protein JHK82_051462 [Glycine max]|nr:hypothetical protein JHK82_051462 [Glycine max]KAG5095741.1 hypothetical protein JHK84_051329 [Glycine max]